VFLAQQTIRERHPNDRVSHLGSCVATVVNGKRENVTKPPKSSSGEAMRDLPSDYTSSASAKAFSNRVRVLSNLILSVAFFGSTQNAENTSSKPCVLKKLVGSAP
jgi:hypothetical protein